MPAHNKFIFALLTSGLLFLGTAHGAAYQWVDENGVTHYTQTPPINEKSVLIEDPKPSTKSSDQAWKELNEQRSKQEAIKKNKELQTKEAEELQKTAENKKEKQQSCEAARTNLTILESGPATRRVKLPSGEYVRLTAEDHQQRLEQARENIKKYCD